MLLEMKVAAITEDEIFKTPIVILKAINGKNCLPIWVGSFEGQAIEYGIKGNQLLRPLPYDTMIKMLQLFNIKIERVIINDLLKSTFYAVIVLNKEGAIYEIDSRPSDAIAIALRGKAPIYVSEEVVKKAISMDINEQLMELEQNSNRNIDFEEAKKDWDQEKWREWLGKLKPEDFGKYEM